MRYIFLMFLTIFFFLFPYTKKILKSYRYPVQFNETHIAKVNKEFGDDFDLKLIENHEFHYIGHGGQAIAFTDENETYVLKLFLYKKLLGKKRFPILSKRKQIRRDLERKKRLHETLVNYSLAYEKIKESTGIIAMYCSHKKLPTVHLIDWEKRKHLVNLTDVPFVLQRKAVTVIEKMEKSGSENVISSLNEFIEQQAKKGFVDKELGFVPQNYGFIGDTPIFIDLGKIEFHENVSMAETEKMQRNLGQWLFLHNQTRCLSEVGK